ncbi:MAG: ferrous iron transport protein B [Desulfobulbus propionicus]|nr:MAG: ferrous iron transport protein B [Desulfobulbus propionicus]
MDNTKQKQEKKNILVGLAGQQNAGKSTIFNMLTGANQHIANYPGVTVDKKSGSFRYNGRSIETVDLPGTYSLTSFSLEERVARDFLITEAPHVVVNVVDASSLKRSLYFTFQLLEMEFPAVIALNMMDVAKTNGIQIDLNRLQDSLGVPVIATVGRKGKGKKELRSAIVNAAEGNTGTPLLITYDKLEPDINALQKNIEISELGGQYRSRWLAVKLLEGDSEIERLFKDKGEKTEELVRSANAAVEKFQQEHDMSVADYMVGCRDRLAGTIIQKCLQQTEGGKSTISEKIDTLVLNRFAAPFFLVLTVFLIYQLSIVQGYELTQYWWPFLAKFRGMVSAILPDAGMIEDPYIRSMGLWMVDSANALLNYIPIFLILFSLIAILEDSGYMARIAFILDKLFNTFGLHGQSTLPYILGGVFAGGCAVPGVMSTKGIPDERSRMATILTVPYMNCLAKIPFYTLLVAVFFKAHDSIAMFFISTFTLFVALLVARLLTSTILRGMETAPFVMELPNYHPPTFFGVGQRAIERTWQYIKKVGTIVIAVSVCVFTLLQFPGIDEEKKKGYNDQMASSIAQFHKKIAATAYAEQLKNEANLLKLINLYTNYKTAILSSGSGGKKAINAKYAKKHPDLFKFLKPGKGENDARIVNKQLRRLSSKRKSIRRQIKEEQITNSFLGMIGRGMEPVTKFAGFDWKINVAILSSFAARESSVATIGVLYQQGADENKMLEERMASETTTGGFTPLHALAVIVFFAMYPPCLATTIMIKVQTGSYKWMLFSIFFPTLLGFLVASCIFSGGSALHLTGIQTMIVFYLMVVALTLAVGMYKIFLNKPSKIVQLPRMQPNTDQ